MDEPVDLGTAAAAAIKAAGGSVVLARQLGITKAALTQWKRIGVPPARIFQVAKISGLPVGQIRPDLIDIDEAV